MSHPTDRSTLLRDARRKLLKSPMGIASLLIIIGYITLVLLAGLDLVATQFAETNHAMANTSPSSQFWLGTDFLGRSVLERAIHGARVAMLVGFFAASISTFLGLILGSVAGYFGGLIDDLVVWLYTTLDSIPYILLISAFAFALGQGLTNLYIALGVTGWVKLCRLTRAEVNKHKVQEYVYAAEAIGANHFQRLAKHILPNVAHLALIQFSLSFVQAIKLEVILSYLGLGVEPGTPSWGMMISDAKVELTQGIWWNLLAATTFMFFLVLSVNIFTDSIRDALDPKASRSNNDL